MTSSAPAPMPSVPDADAVLCALAIAPSTYSRNKNPDLYEDMGVRRAQRRARIVRGLVRQVLRFGAAPAERSPDGFVLRESDLVLRVSPPLAHGVEGTALGYVVALTVEDPAERERALIAYRFAASPEEAPASGSSVPMSQQRGDEHPSSGVIERARVASAAQRIGR